MSNGKKIVKNSIVLMISQFLSKFVNIGLILILTRLLGKDGFGLYSFSFAYASLFGFLIHLGLINLIVREIARNKNDVDTILGKTFPIVIIFAGTTLILMNVLAFLLNWEIHERIVILIFGFYFVFDTFGRYFIAVTRAFEQMEYAAVINFVERILLLVVALFCWLLDYTLIHLAILFTLVQVFKSLLAFMLVRKKFSRFKLQKLSDQSWRLLKEAYPFALGGLFMIVSLRIDLLIMQHFYSADMVGIYSAARRLIESFSFIPENIYYAVFPALSVLYISEKQKFDLTFQRTVIVLTIIAIPLSAGLYILAPRIIDLLFEAEFKDASLALKCLSIAILAIFIRYAIAVTFNSIGKQQLFAIILGISMCVNITLNYIMIPIYQIIGASIAVIMSELTIIICSAPIITKIVPLGWLKRFMPKMIIISILIFITIYYMQDWHLLLIIIFSAFIYFILLLLFKLFSLTELKDFINTYKNKYLPTKGDDEEPTIPI